MSGTRATPRIIVFNMNFIGDVLFTTPALAALRKGYPEAEVTVVVGRRAKDVLVANPDVDHLVEFPRTLSERWQLLRRFFRRFDLSLSLSSRNVERAAWGMALGCRQRWGFNRPETRLFLTGQIEERRDRHWAEDYLELACLAGGKRNGDLPRFYLTPEEKAWAEDFRHAGACALGTCGLVFTWAHPTRRRRGARSVSSNWRGWRMRRVEPR